jgi:hypothetical protein
MPSKINRIPAIRKSTIEKTATIYPQFTVSEFGNTLPPNIAIPINEKITKLSIEIIIRRRNKDIFLQQKNRMSPAIINVNLG